MLGLFIKDLKLLKAQKKMFMLVGIVTAVVLFNIQDGTEMIGRIYGICWNNGGNKHYRL